MATCSYIGIENEDGTVDYTYCHFDGYPEGVGQDVFFLTRDETREIVRQGLMSNVGYPYKEGDSSERVESRDAFFSKENLRRMNAEYAYLHCVDGEWLCFSNTFDSPRLLSHLIKSIGVKV